MTRKIQPILTMLLLAFAGVTLAVQVAKEFRPVEPLQLVDGVNVVCTHATQRCPTCLAVRRLTKETLDKSFNDAVAAGKITFREVNYEHPEAAAFAGEFKVATASVVLASVNDGEVVAWKNLANETWNLYTDESAFKQMLKEQIDAMLQGITPKTHIESREIIFDDDTEFAW